MLKLKALALCLLFFSPSALAEPTIYLVRHAEKEADGGNDPNLTEAGRARANWLAGYFKKKGLTAIFSTDYQRTQQTAAPTAKMTTLPVQTYDPRHLKEFAKSLRDMEGIVLVVGHSNTTPTLVSLLTNEEHEELDERVYDHIYMVTPKGRRLVSSMAYSEPQTPLPDGN
ncbi:SixA phosphatase family protein [Kordiimonas aestuarii]|uniref:SixA phosphatase family protein n=1 Tax=Kordiimonas aestuarii TaxID=1005925 RepID=UPI0021CF7471|nr:phosphoglycerate mutase family protein [Kordiimonas aestuarii]